MNIGSDISGTEYDAATAMLGGKWRMPTKAEAEELASCYTKIEQQEWETGGNGSYYRHYNYIITITGKNGNKIQFNEYHGRASWWTSTNCEGNYNAYVLEHNYNAGCMYLLEVPRHGEFAIRPVCDY